MLPLVSESVLCDSTYHEKNHGYDTETKERR